jgi:hypothetical protein
MNHKLLKGIFSEIICKAGAIEADTSEWKRAAGALQQAFSYHLCFYQIVKKPGK